MHPKQFIQNYQKISFRSSDEAIHLIANAAYREQLYVELHLQLKAKNAPLLRDLLTVEMQDRQDSSIGDFFENLYWCAFLLYRIGNSSDIALLWQAKNIDFDSFSGFDTQFLVGAGVQTTIEHLQALSDENATAILKHILQCQQSGDFDDMESWFQDKMDYYTTEEELAPKKMTPKTHLPKEDPVKIKFFLPEPSFTGLSRNVKNLTITPNGRFLLYEGEHKLQIWEVAKKQLHAIIEGSLVGVANDGQTLITRYVDRKYFLEDMASRSGSFRQELDKFTEPPAVFTAWEIENGRKLNLADISPNTYQRHQRVAIFANRQDPALKIKELLGNNPSITKIELAFNGILENWVMAPDNQHIILAFYQSAGGFDGWFVNCVDINTGATKIRYQIENAAKSLPPIYFSQQHKLMISNHPNHFDIYDLKSGTHLCKIDRFDEPPYKFGGRCFAINPQDKTELAIGYHQKAHVRWHQELNSQQDWYLEDYVNSTIVYKLNLANKGDMVAILKHGIPIKDITFFPDGERVAVLLISGEIQVWHIKTKHILATLATK